MLFAWRLYKTGKVKTGLKVTGKRYEPLTSKILDNVTQMNAMLGRKGLILRIYGAHRFVPSCVHQF
jgi:hypothetical protein